jgi:16S rRNA (cytosine967-C5)-methyltransferase
VQDPAAAAVADFADFEGGIIADLCAAPGGKTVGIADGTNRASPDYVVAADASMGRLKRVRRNLDRLPVLPVGIVVADARWPAIGPVNGVLLDAPCTGTGTLRRHVDGKWRLSPGDVMALAALQSQILEAAAVIVRPGGLLVYATCSLEREENDDRVEAFLETHREFDIEPSVRTDPAWLDNGVLRMLPHVHGFDGSFAARMRRR